AAVGGLLTGLGVIGSARLFDTVLASLRERLIDRALTLPQARVEAAGTGDLVSRASDDVAEVGEGITKVLPAFSGAAFTIVLTGLGLALIDIRYLLALVIVIPVHVYAVRRYLRKAPAIYSAERAAMAARAHELLGSIHGLPTVHAYQLGPARIARITRRSWAVVQLSLRARIVQNIFIARLNLAEFLGMTALLLTGFFLVGQGAGSVGATTTAMLFFLALFGPIAQLLFVIDDLQSAAASLARIVGVIRCENAADAGPTHAGRTPGGSANASPNTGAPAGDGSTDSGRGRSRPVPIAVSGVSFGYDPCRPVLHDLDLFITAGQQVALVGTSGAGKSTLAALIAGVARPGSGRILVGGVDTSTAPSIDQATQVALITQEIHTFAGTLRDDLTLARPSATDIDIADALARVGADGWVNRLPDGLDTVVGAHGERLTAAQAQQLALARLVLADPPVAVLDEATAESGSSGARQLEKASAAALVGRTALVVAHRLSQAAVADRVLVMHAGRIVEDGRHDDLVAAGGRYAELWAAWSSQRPMHPVAEPLR
ncbi:MAG: ABC transporter ATP-binding protein, partial [Nakamurella sp.]